MTVPLFVELCAGTAALSLRLHARGARPPVSRMGAKTGYADAILRVLGLAPGARAAHYLWCEPDPGVRLLLEAYRDADLARAAAGIIRGWSDEEPRALWERLRAEGPPRLPDGAVDAGEVARWQVLGAWAFRRGEPESGYAPRAEPRVGSGGYLRDGTDASLARLQATIEAAPTLPATIAPDARTVDPREVARWAVVGAWSFRAGEPDSGFNRSEAEGHPDSRKYPRDCARLSVDHAALPTLPATIAPDAREVHPPALPPGTIAYLDPPYSDVAPMIPPVPAAQFLPLGTCGREEGDAALRASGLDHLREPVTHLRMAVLEVLRAAGVQAKVLDTVVERIVIDVVDDLVWSQFASDVAFHDKAMLANAPAVAHEHPVPVLDPALALAGAAEGCLGLDIGGDLRQFALRCQAQPGAAAKLSQAVAWAGCALSRRRAPGAREGGSADLAGDLERHCLLRLRVRLDTNTHLRLPGRKTTGYASDLPRSEVVTLARRWHAAGARVCISEAEPIPELVADGWHAVRIDGERQGQKRTFSRQQAEWLTLSHPPAWRPPVQAGLFG